MKDHRELGSSLVISFWPSVQEIEESSLSDGYMAGLAEFYDSVNQLYEDAVKKWKEASEEDRQHCPRLTEYTGFALDCGRKISRNAPPEIIQFLLSLGTSGLAVGLYSLLRLWIEAKNGRKLRIKFGDFEVEGTQMTPEQFQKFVELILTQIGTDRLLMKEHPLVELRKLIEAQNFTMVGQDDRREEKHKLIEAVSKSREKVRKKFSE